MNEFGQTICLNMIAKNEAPVIRRCLDSVRSLCDTWAIVDTGSTDGTQAIIRDYLKDLPGELIERPWIDFATNRSEALAHARGRADYTFVIDADETVEFDRDFRLPKLSADSYHVQVLYSGCAYLRKQLVRSALPWRYQGVVHEYIHCDLPHGEDFLAGLRTVPHPDGARARDPNTYRRDALILEKALIDEPENTRYMFYLAQSYRDAGDWELSLRHYKRRVGMGGWSEEIWYSLYQIALLGERMKKPWAEVMQDYLTAYQFRPDRAEPLYRIGLEYQAKGEYHNAHLFFARAMQIPFPKSDRLFVEQMMYEFLLPIEYAVSCYYVGDHSAAIETNNRLLRKPALPASLIDQVIKNRRFSLDAIFPPPVRRVATPVPVKLCIPFQNAGAGLDDLIESVLQQESAAFEVFFIQDGSFELEAGRIPIADSRFSMIRHATPRGWDACVAQFVAERCAPSDIVFALPVGDRLAAQDSVQKVRSVFDDPQCMLLYGQHRLPSGNLGNAEPAPDATLFAERKTALASCSAKTFRASLLTAERPAERLSDSLMSAAGFQHTRFSDAVLTISDSELPVINAPGTTLRPAPASLSSLPTISCLMVTYNRLALAKRSIQCFRNQTYPNTELVIVNTGSIRYRQALERFVAEAGLPNVRFAYPEGDSLTLGHLRNVSFETARGEVLCQWDDDDCFHPERLMRQAEQMFKEQARACFMTDHLQFLEDVRTVVWVDWTLGGRSRADQLLPGTVMMFNDPRFRYPETGEFSRRGEDSALLYNLFEKIPVASLVGMGHLYLYTYHGRNTFSREHHHWLSTYSVDAAEMQRREETIRRALAHYPVPKPLMVSGRNGPAFFLNE